MDKKEIFNRIEYVVACVGAFAQRYQISNMQAYAYLRRFITAPTWPLNRLTFRAVSVARILDKDSISTPILTKPWRWQLEQLDS